MSRFLKHLGALLCGIFTSFAVALGVSLIYQHTDHDVFNFTHFYLVPVGAILCGCFAATSFYAASLYFHIRASFALLVQMLIVVGCAQTFIYWMDYQTALFGDGGLVHEALGFLDYFQVSQTMASYKLRRFMDDTGEVGLWGYAIVLLKFLGFAGGSVVVYSMLRASIICEQCAQYMKELKRKYHVFQDAEAFTTHYEALFSHDLHAPEFKAALTHIQDEKPVKGSYKITHILYGCPECNAQLFNPKIVRL